VSGDSTRLYSYTDTTPIEKFSSFATKQITSAHQALIIVTKPDFEDFVFYISLGDGMHLKSRFLSGTIATAQPNQDLPS